MKSVLKITTMARLATAALLIVGLTAAAPAGIAAFAERFTAFAVDLGVPAGGIDVPQPRDRRVPSSGKAGPVEFVVNRYSTDAERDMLLKTLQEKGPDKLLEALQKLPRIGYFRTPNSIGYDLKFARKVPGGYELIRTALQLEGAR